MNRLGLLILMMIMAAALTACAGSGDTTAQGGSTAQQVDTDGAQAEATLDEASLLSGAEVAKMVEDQAVTPEAPQGAGAAPVEASAVSLDAELPVDLDLTGISGTVVYSQVYDMMTQPENYIGQRIRMKGSFNYFKDADTNQEYFAAIIADVTACCAQGIEFVWRGEHTYPQDYPPLNTEITVTGTFSTYYEGDYMFAQLVDAKVEWNA